MVYLHTQDSPSCWNSTAIIPLAIEFLRHSISTAFSSSDSCKGDMHTTLVGREDSTWIRLGGLLLRGGAGGSSPVPVFDGSDILASC